MNKKLFFLFLISISCFCSDDFQKKVISNDFGYVEGPIWDAKNNRFLFSDIPKNKIYSIKLDGSLSVFDENSNYSNGLAIDKQGYLWSARHDRVLSRRPMNSPKKEIKYNSYKGKMFNSPNDLIIASDSSIWFTDPTFGIEGNGPKQAPQEQPVRGIYHLKDERIQLKNGDLIQPNGIALSPDEKKLYVSDSTNGYVYEFEIKNDELSKAKVLFKTPKKEDRDPQADGLEVDSAGNIYVARHGGVGVYNSKGAPISFYPIKGVHVSNIAFGGANKSIVLITASVKVILISKKELLKSGLAH